MSDIITIERAGMMMTVQDTGRPGLLASGVSASGANDPEARAIGNALVGNGQDAAVVEFALMGGAIRAGRDCRVAVTGGACEIAIDGIAVPGWESHILKAGQLLSIGALRGATWGYIAISGGIDTPPVLGSRATHLRTALGGLEGRMLRDGDTLPLGTERGGQTLRLGRIFRRPIGPIRIVPGPQDDYFSQDVWRLLVGKAFSIGKQRDRMAAILDGPLLPAFRGHDIVSDGTLAGSIQVPSSGRPIVLMADRQTTGGYPKIATLCSADLPRFAQLPSGQEFHFRAIRPEQAEEAGIEARTHLAEVLASLVPASSTQPVLL